MYFIFILYFFFTDMFSNLYQNKCEVLLNNINKFYEGECKNGLAEGFGKAYGIDSFVGYFNKGLPDGEGKYFFNNRDYYIGEFKKGKFNGKGEYFKYNLITNSWDTVIKGFWKNSTYTGSNVNPYKLINRSAMVKEVVFTKEELRYNSKVTIEVTRENTGQSSINYSDVKPSLRGINLKSGSYTNIESTTTQNIKNIYYLLNVEFPFKAVLEIDDEQVEVEINQKADWKIFIKLRFTDL